MRKQDTYTESNALEIIVNAKYGDSQAMGQVIRNHIGLVKSYIRKHPFLVANTSLDEEDLTQVGILGLMRAVETFNPEKGAFSTYSYLWIKQYILHEYEINRSSVRYPSYLQRKVLKYIQVNDRFREKWGRDLTISETVDILGFSKEETKKIINIEKQNYVCSLDVPVDGNTEICLMDFIEDETGAAGYLEVESEIDTDILMKLIAKMNLDEKEMFVLYNRLFVSDPVTLEECGRQIHLSKERIRQIEKNVIRKLRSNRGIRKYCSESGYGRIPACSV